MTLVLLTSFGIRGNTSPPHFWESGNETQVKNLKWHKSSNDRLFERSQKE